MSAAIVDHLWQSTLVLFAVAGLTRLLCDNGAPIRYALWFAASLKFLVPFSLLVATGGALAPYLSVSRFAAPVAIQHFAEPFTLAEPILIAAIPSADDTSITVVLVLLWAAGFAVVLLSWLIHWLRLARSARAATPLALAAPIPVVASPSFVEPGLFGILRPVLLLPAGLAARLAPEELHAILAHELCHLRRRDNLTAFIHMLVEALFWFHPLVWWLGARLIEERERACDEYVVRSGRDPRVYAEAILKVCRFHLQPALGCAAGLSGSDLQQRVEAIMAQDGIARLGLSRKLMLAVAAVAVVAAPLFVGFAAPAVAAPSLVETGTVSAQAWVSAAAIRHHIDEILREQPDLTAIDPRFANLARRQQPTVQQKLKDWGPVKSIVYRGTLGTTVVYDVTFTKAKTEWRIRGTSAAPAEMPSPLITMAGWNFSRGR